MTRRRPGARRLTSAAAHLTGPRGRYLAGILVVGSVIGVLVAAVMPHATPAAEGVGRSAPFGRSIDPYARYVEQARCDQTPKPGIVDVRNLLVTAYGSRWSGISGDCSGALPSEHKEGRALDIAFDAGTPSDRAKADDLLRWLLATDEYGNAHAMARRLGVMYIVWNRHIWRSYRPAAGWQPYTGTPNPHTDHIHLSFSWDGALRRTTWWTQGVPTAN